jgi:hypothetical protein
MLGDLRPREARPTSLAWVVAKTLIQMAIFWTTFLVVLPTGILWLESQCGLDFWRFPGPITTVLGIGLFGLGGALGLTCAMTMALLGRGTPRTRCGRAIPLRPQPDGHRRAEPRGGRGAFSGITSRHSVRPLRRADLAFLRPALGRTRPRRALRRTLPPLPSHRSLLAAQAVVRYWGRDSHY